MVITGICFFEWSLVFSVEFDLLVTWLPLLRPATKTPRPSSGTLPEGVGVAQKSKLIQCPDAFKIRFQHLLILTFNSWLYIFIGHG